MQAAKLVRHRAVAKTRAREALKDKWMNCERKFGSA
jgi:hypothetical protein